VPGYTRFDSAVYYDLNEHWTAQVNVEVTVHAPEDRADLPREAPPVWIWGDATIRFELLRSLHFSRLFWWGALAMFPLLVAQMLRSLEPEILRDEGGVGFLLYVLIVRMLCPLSLLLWATPAIHAEVEGRTWGYVAVRPGGRAAVLFGKYLAAVTWSFLLGWISLAAFLTLVYPEGWSTLGGLFSELILLSSLTYGALYLLIGVLFLKRAMVITVSYTLLVEVFL